MSRLIRLYLIFLSFFALFFIAPDTYAKSDYMIVYPNVVELDFTQNNNKFISGVVFAENPTTKPIRVRAYLESWNMDDYGKIIFSDQPDNHSLNNSIKFNPREFELQPGQKQVIRLTAKMPNGVEGELRSIIFFETVSSKSEILKQDSKKLNININFKTRYGVAVYAYNGTTSKSAELKNLNYEKSDNNYLVATIKNPGNIHCNVEGLLTLKNKNFDSEGIKTVVSRYTILPGKTQKYKILLPKDLINNTKYLANIRLVYTDTSGKEQVIVAEKEFIYKEMPANLNVTSKVLEENIQPTSDNTAQPLQIQYQPNK